MAAKVVIAEVVKEATESVAMAEALQLQPVATRFVVLFVNHQVLEVVIKMIATVYSSYYATCSDLSGASINSMWDHNGGTIDNYSNKLDFAYYFNRIVHQYSINFANIFLNWLAQLESDRQHS